MDIKPFVLMVSIRYRQLRKTKIKIQEVEEHRELEILFYG